MIRIISALVLGAGLSIAAQAQVNKFFNLDKEHVPDQLIVKFKPGFHSQSLSTLESMQAKSLRSFSSNGAQLVQFFTASDSKALFEKAKQLSAMPHVEYVEANTIIRLESTPNDPRYEELYGLHNEGATGGTSDSDIDAPEAWQVSTGSMDVLVGVIDTGIDYNHPDIKDNYWNNPGEVGLDAEGRDKKTNGVDDDNNGFVDDWRGWDFVNNDNDPFDDHSHGTHCAGTIGAKGNNGVGVVGVNWDVSLVGIKFLSASGSGSLADAVSAIEYGTTIGADLTSNSWGGGGFSQTMEDAIRGAHDAGILFVAAAGNSSSNNDVTPHYPSSYDVENVIAVAASDHDDGIASFSSYGRRSVHLAAPGVDILSSTPSSQYKKYSGTSMATPHVAGAVALVKSVYPDMGHLSVKNKIIGTVDPAAEFRTRTITGGRLNLYNAVENDLVPPGLVEGITVVSSEMTSVDLNFTATGDDGLEGKATRYLVRVSEQAITSEELWEAAKKVDTAITSENDNMSVRIESLPVNFEGYVAIRAVDNAANIGPISASVPLAVKRVQVLAQDNADSLDNVEAEGSWGLEEVAGDHVKVFSDSPEGEYGKNLDISLTFRQFPISGNNYLLVFDTKYDLETNYDYGYLEIRSNLSPEWKKIGTYNGVAEWNTVAVQLNDKIDAGAEWFQIRFHMTSDQSVQKQGWLIDNLMLLAPISE